MARTVVSLTLSVSITPLSPLLPLHIVTVKTQRHQAETEDHLIILSHREVVFFWQYVTVKAEHVSSGTTVGLQCDAKEAHKTNTLCRNTF